MWTGLPAVAQERRQSLVASSQPTKKSKMATAYDYRTLPYSSVARPRHHDKIVESFTSDDILLGKGNGINCLPGNVKFRKIINEYKSLYQESPRHLKHKVAERVLDEIAAMGGRFLEQQPDKRFLVVSKQRRMEKTCQALREKKSGGKGGVVHAFTKSILHSRLQSKNKSPTELQLQAHNNNNIKSRTNLKSSSTNNNLRDLDDDDDGDIQVMSNDVLYSGRGRKFFHHPANQRFQDYIKQCRYAYWNTQSSKKQVALQIIQNWRQQTPPGRFLELKAKDEWYEMPEDRVLEKVCQALRDLKRSMLPLEQENNDTAQQLQQQVWPNQTHAAATILALNGSSNNSSPTVVCPVWISPTSSRGSLESLVVSPGKDEHLQLSMTHQPKEVETAAILTMLGMGR